MSVTRSERNVILMQGAADAGAQLAAEVLVEVVTRSISVPVKGGTVLGVKVFCPIASGVVEALVYLAYDEDSTEWTGERDIAKGYRWSSYPWTKEREQGGKLADMLARAIKADDKTRHFELVEIQTDTERTAR